MKIYYIKDICDITSNLYDDKKRKKRQTNEKEWEKFPK